MRTIGLLSVSILMLGLALGSTTPADPGTVATANVAGLGSVSGHITLLRVHDVGTGYGPPADAIDVEVIVQLDTQPGSAYGFQLRDDANRPAREGMLALLRDAFANDWTVHLDYYAEAGHNNSVAFRVWLTK